ncbi:E1A-binding protein p400-like isoform X3 [Periplaneta americana]|uniref:E1A-binding protein p400-like isoform X3 n=1 Tax=Periplaneta americana TaxID=6978 RepID=UPI0037E821C4
MAIPFNLPNQQEVEDYYQILDQLFQQLYEIVRQILLRQRRQQQQQQQQQATSSPTSVPRNRPAQRSDTGRHTQPNVSNYQQQSEDEVRRVQPLPDLVLSTVSGQAPRSAAPEAPVPVPPPRRRASDVDRDCPQPPPRRPRRRRCSSCRGARISWMQIGKELRKIADEFRTGSHLQVGRREPNDRRR